MFVHLKCSDTDFEKSWTYSEYYVGDKDNDGRKNGQGENHWSGAKSLEWYSGHILNDALHGPGEYRWRHLGADGVHFSYEGRFFCNHMHGYGTMSYPDGRVFNGLFHSDIRWGPGVESHTCLEQDVGLWAGVQLIRLAWRPEAASIVPDLFSTADAKTCVEPHRILLKSSSKIIGESNSAIDLLKHYGADPILATEKWPKLYPKNCTDLLSPFCRVADFEHDYYKGNIPLLEQVIRIADTDKNSPDDEQLKIYYAWNNDSNVINMMRHSFTHDKQRNPTEVDLVGIMSGNRKKFRPPGKHELYCRTVLMASYLGHVANVVQLVNVQGVHPNITDNVGNNSVMYAACGDHPDLIHFLVEAGANVDNFNDSCCTALGVNLLRYACIQRDVPASDMVQALEPPSMFLPPPAIERKISEWNITHDQRIISPAVVGRTPSKISKNATVKRLKSTQSLKDISMNKNKKEPSILKTSDHIDDVSVVSLSEDKRTYDNVTNEYSAKINDLYQLRPHGANIVTYLFEVNNMLRDINSEDEEQKKTLDKVLKREKSKEIRAAVKPSKEVMWQNIDKEENSSNNSIEKQKDHTLHKIMDTILQLLADGANPNLIKCPQPSLFIAIVSGSADLIQHLVNHGADINEVCYEVLAYKPIDIAISQPFTNKNQEMVQTLLNLGARVDHRLYVGNLSISDPSTPDHCGPTLLHAVLARKTGTEIEEEVRYKLIELLLEHNCDAAAQFKGHSAIEMAMSKSLALLDVFTKSRNTNLNVPINDLNQSILVKMFSLPFFKTIPSIERVHTLTNLLLYGADPLLQCANGDEEFANIFVFGRKTLSELDNTQGKLTSNVSTKVSSNKSLLKKTERPKKEATSMGRLGTDDVGDYNQALDLVTECARMLHERWIRAKLMKELVETINRYKHRHWNMIIRELKNGRSAGLWLNPQRSLEIWDIMKTTKRKVYHDNRVLKHLLHIVSFLNTHQQKTSAIQPTAQEKNTIEIETCYLLRDRKITSKIISDETSFVQRYVMPEFTSNAEKKKFNICFECAFPSDKDSIVCDYCEQVSFCTLACLSVNVGRLGSHPCSNYLREKYLSTPNSPTLNSNSINL